MTRPLWTSEEIAAATGGRENAAFEVRGVSIDSRSVEAGDLFVALAGGRDGHEFVAGALAQGAAGSLTSRPVDGPKVTVENVFKALEKIGIEARIRASDARRGAVTGSVGKTSVTRAVEAGLRLAGRAHASVKSYNNHIGVPLTLARMPAETQRAVFEIGMNHAREIGPLAQMVRPHVVAITTVGPVHIENFLDGEVGVAKAKAEIFEGLEPGGVAVLNADDFCFPMLRQAALAVGASVRSFGAAPDAYARLIGFQADENGATVEAVIGGQPLLYRLLQSGAHWGPNSLCVLLMLEALDVDRATALTALANFTPLEGRGAERKIALAEGAFTLIDESYNANPISMAAALRSLGARSVPGRRVVAMTDMLELGRDGAKFHAALAEPIADANVDSVFCAGPLMANLWEALPLNRRGGYARTAEELALLVVGAVRPGDAIMVKGSNGSSAGLIATALAASGGGV